MTLTFCTKKYIYLYLVLYVCFVDRCLSFCTFSFGHCAVCSSSIYGFWLPLWFFQNRLWSEIFNGNSEWFLIYAKWVILSHILYSKATDELAKKELNEASFQSFAMLFCFSFPLYKGNNKITELRTILQRESQNS